MTTDKAEYTYFDKKSHNYVIRAKITTGKYPRIFTAVINVFPNNMDQPEIQINNSIEKESSIFGMILNNNPNFSGLIKIKQSRNLNHVDIVHVKMNVVDGKLFGRYPNPAVSFSYPDGYGNIKLFCDENGMLCKDGPSMKIRKLGLNFLYFANYDCYPKSYISENELLSKNKVDFEICGTIENPLYNVTRKKFSRMLHNNLRNYPRPIKKAVHAELLKSVDFTTPTDELFIKYFELDNKFS